jgi:hypothetical protein
MHGRNQTTLENLRTTTQNKHIVEVPSMPTLYVVLLPSHVVE